MSTDTTARPTQADAREAMDVLGTNLLEDVASPAMAYLQDRLAEYGQDPLWGRDAAMFVAAVALAIRAYAAQEDPAATWPSRAARRLADDARPTTEGSGR